MKIKAVTSLHRRTEDNRTAKIFLPLGLTLALMLSLVLVVGSTTEALQNKNTGLGPSDSAELFLRNCAKCHGKDGRAKTFKGKLLGARNLTDDKWQDSVTDERLFNSINNGKGSMPAWGKKLSQAEINALVPYVRNLKKQ